MILTFHSTDSEGGKVLYRTDYVIENNKIKFKDETTPDTYISLTVNNDSSLLFVREGKTNMELLLDPNNKTLGHYRNEMGLELEIVVITKNVVTSPKKITVEYETDIYDVKTNHKIWIMLN